ncbi:hypothetical protein V1512DRAFT_273692, partial [Lipomyces arxii]|uniref:uncharacterized protein n=1 Tax=Lipomyces arxii TaxID=56418 RepID=UPI0034CDCC94
MFAPRTILRVLRSQHQHSAGTAYSLSRQILRYSRSRIFDSNSTVFSVARREFSSVNTKHTVINLIKFKTEVRDFHGSSIVQTSDSPDTAADKKPKKETAVKPAPRPGVELLEEKDVDAKEQRKADWAIMKEMMKYLWPKGAIGVKTRVIIALALLVLSKVTFINCVSVNESDTRRFLTSKF